MSVACRRLMFRHRMDKSMSSGSHCLYGHRIDSVLTSYPLKSSDRVSNKHYTASIVDSFLREALGRNAEVLNLSRDPDANGRMRCGSTSLWRHDEKQCGQRKGVPTG